MYIHACKVVFITLLVVIFSVYFGYPSFDKYSAKKTMIVETTVKFKASSPPAISISAVQPSNKSYSRGWKVDNLNGCNIIARVCNKSENITHTLSCIDDNTFKFPEVIEQVKNGDKDLKDPALWNRDIYHFFYGNTYTINSSYTLGTCWAESLEILPNESHYYYIWIHDPHFFVQSLNPDAIPQIHLTLNSIEQVWVYIRPVYHEMMDKPEKRCESSESYSFTACIKNSISRKIGCRLEWDSWSSRDIPVCTTVEQLKRFENENENLWKLYQPTLVQNTGCLVPCSYTDYKLATEPWKMDNNPQKLCIGFSRPDVLKRTEKQIYPLESFVSEFGGALGLFLGFSCTMIWDGLEILFFHYLKNSQTMLFTN